MQGGYRLPPTEGARILPLAVCEFVGACCLTGSLIGDNWRARATAERDLKRAFAFFNRAIGPKAAGDSAFLTSLNRLLTRYITTISKSGTSDVKRLVDRGKYVGCIVIVDRYLQASASMPSPKRSRDPETTSIASSSSGSSSLRSHTVSTPFRSGQSNQLPPPFAEYFWTQHPDRYHLNVAFYCPTTATAIVIPAVGGGRALGVYCTRTEASMTRYAGQDSRLLPCEVGVTRSAEIKFCTSLPPDAGSDHDVELKDFGPTFVFRRHLQLAIPETNAGVTIASFLGQTSIATSGPHSHLYIDFCVCSLPMICCFC
jgi:hypothetical protein